MSAPGTIAGTTALPTIPEETNETETITQTTLAAATPTFPTTTASPPAEMPSVLPAPRNLLSNEYPGDCSLCVQDSFSPHKSNKLRLPISSSPPSATNFQPQIQSIQQGVKDIKTSIQRLEQREIQLYIQLMDNQQAFFLQCMEQFFMMIATLRRSHSTVHTPDEEPQAPTTDSAPLDTGTFDDHLTVLTAKTNITNPNTTYFGLPTVLYDQTILHSTQQYDSSGSCNYSIYKHISMRLNLL